jgi:hypothetical protein
LKRILLLVLALTALLPACSFVGDVFFPKPEQPVLALAGEVTRAPNTDAFTVTDDMGRVWRQKDGEIFLDDEPVRFLEAAEDSPISYIEGCLYYMAPKGFTRYDAGEEKLYPLYYDVMDAAVAGLNRIYYVRDNMLFAFFASETEIDVKHIAYLTDGFEMGVTDNLLHIQGHTIDLLTDTIRE